MQELKKILIIGLTERMGGVETFIYNTTKFSDKNEYQYDYLVHGTKHCVFQKEINNFYGSNQHIFFIRKYKENPFGCLRDIYKFYKSHGKEYSYVHLQTGATTEVLYVFPFCLFYKFKVITHSHNGNGYSPIINTTFRPIVNLITNKRLACSEAAARWLFGKSKSSKALIINNGIDVKRFTFNFKQRQKIRKKYNIHDELVIGHVGRFSEQKNHIFIIKIFEEILKKNTNVKLMLVGVGEREKDIKNLCIQKRIEKNVIFTGKQINTEEYYSAFDVFLMPSLYEGLPIVGIEAQSEGLLCLFSENIDKQILISNRAQMISLSLSPEKWADKILKSLSNENREAYANEVRKAGYDIKDTVNVLKEIYS